MSVVDVTGCPNGVRVPMPARSRRLPHALSRCDRVVAVTVRLPEFLLAAAGAVQRLDAAGVAIDLLELSWQNSAAERAAVAALDRLELAALTRHRLAIPPPFGVERTDDVVAAMSELIGFDPEPGVVCLVAGSGGDDGAAYQAVSAAAELVADAYRMRVLRYSPSAGERTADVELDADEWRRKCESLAACAPDVAPLSGRREYFGG
jgi:hypothetical protein